MAAHVQSVERAVAILHLLAMEDASTSLGHVAASLGLAKATTHGLLATLRELCLAYPRAAERTSHGRPNWFTTKTFASYGAHVKGSHGDTSLARALVIKPDPDHRDLLLGDDRFVVPAYDGPSGWLALPLDAHEPDWDEVDALIEESYRQTAPAARLRELDAWRPG